MSELDRDHPRSLSGWPLIEFGRPTGHIVLPTEYAVRISENQLAALRTALNGEAEEFERLAVSSDVDHGNGFPVLVGHAFVLAARRGFPHDYSTSDVIRFVGKLRSRDSGEFADISVTAAEQMLLCALRGVPMDSKSDEFAKGYAQVAVLAELVSNLNDQQLEALLEQARDQADQWLADHA
jgi:hypothetical protein